MPCYAVLYLAVLYRPDLYTLLRLALLLLIAILCSTLLQACAPSSRATRGTRTLRGARASWGSG